MLFQLRLYGRRTTHGDGFTEYTSDFVVPMEPLVFQKNAATNGRGLVDIQYTSHTSLESSDTDDEEFSGDRALHEPLRSSVIEA